MVIHDSKADKLTATCHKCGESYGATEVRWHTLDGGLVSFGPSVTQAKINAVSLRCELCQEDED